MNGYPQGLYPDKVGLDCSNISAIIPFTGNPESECVFEVSNIYAGGRFQPPTWLEMTPEEFFPFIDKFGQFKHKDWPGKIHSDAELSQARVSEAALMAADSGPKEWDKWGGLGQWPDARGDRPFPGHQARGQMVVCRS